MVITRYTLPLPILRQILGLFCPFPRPKRAPGDPWGPQTNILYFVCVVPVIIYLFHASWGLKHFVHGVEISKSSFSSQIMLIPGPLGPRGLAVTGGHPIIFLRAHLDCPWPEPYKSWCPCWSSCPVLNKCPDLTRCCLDLLQFCPDFPGCLVPRLPPGAVGHVKHNSSGAH